MLERTHGARPVVLVGFGVGARLLYEAVLELASALDDGDGRAAGVIQHVILMGLPATCEMERWAKIRKVAAGRVVNCAQDPVIALLSLCPYTPAVRAPMDRIL